MNVKNVVKVMNFHALVRVDNARREAVRYMEMDEVLLGMMDQILNNRNFNLDKQLPKPDEKKPPLVIYIGSDYGFCSNYNSQVSAKLLEDPTSDKIIIGKKLRMTKGSELLRIHHSEFASYKGVIGEIIRKSVLEQEHSAIYVVYNRYLNAAQIQLENRKLFPIDIPPSADKSRYKDDFAVEGDLTELLVDILMTYLMQELQLALISGFASENVMRQNTTHESLKKIEEREEEALREERKEKKAEDFGKLQESFVQSKYRGVH